MPRKPRTLRPTKLLATLAAILATDPNISGAKLLIRAGYSMNTARHSMRRTLDSPTLQQALEQSREVYRTRLRSRLSPERAADRLADLVDSKNDFAALQALERALEHLGIVEQRDRKQVIVFAFQLCVNRFAPLVTEFVPEDQRAAFARKVSEVFELEASQVTEPASQETQALQTD